MEASLREERGVERPHNSMSIAEEKLKSIYCPECREEHSANDMTLKVKFWFQQFGV